MKRLAGGRFSMGSDHFYPDESPIQDACVDAFWIDATPVTNAQFARFVAQTGYVTFAEKAPDPAQYPGLLPELSQPGSLVFTPTREPGVVDPSKWWRYVVGASWCHPFGPTSDLAGLDDHPVVHVAYSDAQAYARWAGKALPTEAEWEFAARGGLDGATYAWGNEFEPDGRTMAKIWQGEFPWKNLAPPGLERTSPVRSYPPNGFGLYDMIGNVWEWCTDPYVPVAPSSSPARKCCGQSSATSIPLRVAKGGSHLCAPNYCQRYRPAARWGQPIDTTTSHFGFRCIVRDG